MYVCVCDVSSLPPAVKGSQPDGHLHPHPVLPPCRGSPGSSVCLDPHYHFLPPTPPSPGCSTNPLPTLPLQSQLPILLGLPARGSQPCGLAQLAPDSCSGNPSFLSGSRPLAGPGSPPLGPAHNVLAICFWLCGVSACALPFLQRYTWQYVATGRSLGLVGGGGAGEGKPGLVSTSGLCFLLLLSTAVGLTNAHLNTHCVLCASTKKARNTVTLLTRKKNETRREEVTSSGHTNGKITFPVLSQELF